MQNEQEYYDKFNCCGRCFEQVDYLFPAICAEDPTLLVNEPIGMYHCPECGTMVLAGQPHPMLCKRCLLGRHPEYDYFIWQDISKAPKDGRWILLAKKWNFNSNENMALCKWQDGNWHSIGDVIFEDPIYFCIVWEPIDGI